MICYTRLCGKCAFHTRSAVRVSYRTASTWRAALRVGLSSQTSRGVSSAPKPAEENRPISDILADAAALLPKQAILENFVHHNPYEVLQNMNFFTALELVHDANLYMSPGERLFEIVNVDPRLRCHEALIELSSVFLDRGAAKWAAPNRDRGFLYFFASLEDLGYAPWRGYSRTVAAKILLELDTEMAPFQQLHSQEALAESILRENLEFFGAEPDEFLTTTRAMLNDMQGWAGMFQRMEEHPEEAPPNTNVRLIDFCAVYTTLMRASMESLARQAGWNPSTPLGDFMMKAPKQRKDTETEESLQNPSGLAFTDQNFSKTIELENQFEEATLRAFQEPKPMKNRPILQLFTCIDERECSLRRYTEAATGNPDEIETFGVPGFFGFQVNYKKANSVEYSVLAPEGAVPKATLVEVAHAEDISKTNRFNQVRKVEAELGVIWEKASLNPVGSLLNSAMVPINIGRLFLMTCLPEMRTKIKKDAMETIAPAPRTDFENPFSPESASNLLAGTFKDIGIKQFAPIVALLGHGSSSQNNPFAAAYNCGACGGREGGPNARLMARSANTPEIREHLRKDHGINIPDDTWFAGGYHDTCSDEIIFFDVDKMPPSMQPAFDKSMEIINKARGQHALERCRRFMSAQEVKTEEEALQHVLNRSQDLGEARPELNHATNAAVIIGRRGLTKGFNLSRRAFLPTYDPFNDDDNGTNLERVITPALIVCSGINLEYFFSTVEGGAGTKVPMNLVGHLGLQQGTAGDLLHGLPTQTTEMHVPVRALYIIDAPVPRVEAVLARREMLREIVHNEWIRCVVRDPRNGTFWRCVGGEFRRFYPQEANPGAEVSTWVPFDHHSKYGKEVTEKEYKMMLAGGGGMLASFVLPNLMFTPMHPHGALVAAGGTALALSSLYFSRRYLHGEFMFGRLALLQTGMLAGFNIVATAPNLPHVLAGWGLMGYCSTFLIGAFNDRPTVKENTTYVFAAYQLCDCAALTAAAFSAHHAQLMGHGEVGHSGLCAAGLIAAALLKSGQFPLTNLLSKSMEGATPTSALGYAGLSAHAGIVLLSATTPMWFEFTWARCLLAATGAATATHAGLVANIRADRKGALANATSATLGSLFVLLAAGYTDAALVLSCGHAAFRMIQFMRSPNFITDTRTLQNALGHEGKAKIEAQPVSEGLWKLGWKCNRINTDMGLPHIAHLPRFKETVKDLVKDVHLSKTQQWVMASALTFLAGAQFTPLVTFNDHKLMELLHTQPVSACGIMAFQVTISALLVRTIFTRVLDPERFAHPTDWKKKELKSLPELWKYQASWSTPDDIRPGQHGFGNFPEDTAPMEWSDSQVDAEAAQLSWQTPDDLPSIDLGTTEYYSDAKDGPPGEGGEGRPPWPKLQQSWNTPDNIDLDSFDDAKEKAGKKKP